MEIFVKTYRLSIPNAVFYLIILLIWVPHGQMHILFYSQNQPPEDKGALITDNNPSSPYYGRTYITGVNFRSPYPVLFAYTTNSGINWSSYSGIHNSAATRNSGGELAIGRLGRYMIYGRCDSGATSQTETYASFGYSTDGGSNWTYNTKYF